MLSIKSTTLSGMSQKAHLQQKIHITRATQIWNLNFIAHTPGFGGRYCFEPHIRNNMKTNTIIHNPALSRFEITIDSQTAVIDYQPVSPQVWIISHTKVPAILEGQGIASHLAKTLLTYCRQKNIKIIPECSFVVSYLQRHPEWNDVIANE
ncbi:GNAT family N-acetyltransferase [Geofilum sp. OHC36d9]|uniref:GNAT family N-acetyltransferase n=1 Tax=Geofilum sp. OHC36d9 TaxID=3458413 RepID=UPI0040349698